MADGAWRMNVKQKMHALNREIGLQNKVVPGAQLDHRGIITDAEPYARRPPRHKALQPENEFGLRSKYHYPVRTGFVRMRGS